jgi:hypothetical protein
MNDEKRLKFVKWEAIGLNLKRILELKILDKKKDLNENIELRLLKKKSNKKNEMKKIESWWFAI